MVSVRYSQAHRLPAGRQANERITNQDRKISKISLNQEKKTSTDVKSLWGSDLSFSHKISCYGHVLEEDGEVESTVAFSVCDGGICSVSHQLDHHGEVPLPHRGQKPKTDL